MTEAAQKLKTESINQDVTQRITTVQEGPGGIKDTGAEFELQKQHITELARLDLVSQSQAIQMIRQIETAQHNADAEKLQSERDYIALQMQSLAAVGGDVAKLEEQYTRVLKQIADEKRKFDAEMAQDDQKMWNTMMQGAQRATQIISSSFTSAFDRMLTTHTSFGNVMKQFWNQMVLGFEKMGLQIVATEIQQIAMRVAAEIAGQTLTTAAATAGAAQRSGIGLLENLKSIESAAATAAANAYKWVMEDVPFPVNAALAPAAAAAAFTGVMAFGSIASAAGGMEVLHDQVAMVHKNEMILPANLSQGFRNIISGNGTAGAAGAGGSKGVGSGGGGTSNHVHIGSITLHGGGSREEMRDVLDSELVPRIQKAMRRGALG
jgi:hypothetical protein